MRKTYRKKFLKPKGKPEFRVNEQIFAPQVRLIDDRGQQRGVLSLTEALKAAQEKSLDLVEVNPKAQPPVAKILNYGQFQYQQSKEERKARAHHHEVEIKGVRLSLRIGEHDLALRQKQAKKFLTEGNKVKIEMILRGREQQHQGLARQIINNFLKEVETAMPVRIEEEISKIGNRLSLVIGRK